MGMISKVGFKTSRTMKPACCISDTIEEEEEEEERSKLPNGLEEL